ncbi:MAG: hypothetical protein WDN50_18360 [Bradyrhizobium sp.]
MKQDDLRIGGLQIVKCERVGFSHLFPRIGAHPGAAKNASRNGNIASAFFNPEDSAAALESPHKNNNGLLPGSIQSELNRDPGASRKHLF